MKTKAKVDKNGGIHLSLNCDCGKPLTITTEYGMFCEDKCGMEESKKAAQSLKNLLSNFEKNFKNFKGN